MKNSFGIAVILLGLSMFVASLLVAGVSAANAELRLVYEPQVAYWKYVVQSGDTLPKICAKYLEDSLPDTCNELAQELGLHDPLVPGQIVRLPFVHGATCDDGSEIGWSRDEKEINDSIAIKATTESVICLPRSKGGHFAVIVCPNGGMVPLDGHDSVLKAAKRCN